MLAIGLLAWLANGQTPTPSPRGVVPTLGPLPTPLPTLGPVPTVSPSPTPLPPVPPAAAGEPAPTMYPTPKPSPTPLPTPTMYPIPRDVPTPTTTTQPTTTSAPAAITIDQSSVKALLLTLHQASEALEYNTFARCSGDQTKALMEAMANIQKTAERLLAVMDKKLGNAADEFKKSPLLPRPAGLNSPLAIAVVNGRVDWAKIKIVETGDTATISIGDSLINTSKAYRIDGKWYWVGPDESWSPEFICKFVNFRITVAARLENGLEDGSITKDNFNKMLKKLYDESEALWGKETATQPARMPTTTPSLRSYLQSSDLDRIYCAASYLAENGGPAVPKPFPTQLSDWQSHGTKLIEWLGKQSPKKVNSLEDGFPAFVQKWSPYFPPLASQPTTGPATSIATGQKLEEAVLALKAAGAKDISDVVSIKMELPSRLTWFEIKDGTCICLASKPDATGEHRIASIELGETAKGYGDKVKWMEQRRRQVMEVRLRDNIRPATQPASLPTTIPAAESV